MDDFNKELKRIIDEKEKELDKKMNALFEKGKEDFLKNIPDKTKDDFLNQKKEKKKKRKKSDKVKTSTKNEKNRLMKRLLSILIILVALGFVYYKFIRTNNNIKAIEYSLTTTKIGDLKSDPRDYEGKEVTVSGIVKSSFNLGIKYYIIDDETGSVYVITSKAVPQEGELVKVTGVFNQRLKIGDNQVETITEK